MIRNLKALGLSLVALLAMGALSASSASAVDDVFTVAGGGTALLTGTGQDHVFKYYPTGAAYKCTTSKFAGTVKSGEKHATVDATYDGTKEVTPHTTHCNAEPFGNVVVHMNGCDYDLTGTTDAAKYTSDASANDATVSITCPIVEGVQKEITITHSAGAVLHIPPQTPTAGGVTYHNVANGDVQVTATATGITVNCTPTFTCTLGGIPHHSNSTEYTGTVTVAGYEDTEGLPTPVTEGAPVNVEVS